MATNNFFIIMILIACLRFGMVFVFVFSSGNMESVCKSKGGFTFYKPEGVGTMCCINGTAYFDRYLGSDIQIIDESLSCENVMFSKFT